MSWKVLSAVSLVVIVTLVTMAASPSRVAARTYSEIAGSPNCPSGTHLLNLEPPAAGTFTLSNGGRVVISNLTATSFDWAIHADSIRVIDAGIIIVKGGPAAALYTYSPGVDADDADTGLRAPLDPSNNQPYPITQIRFCFDPKRPGTPTATATATVSPTATVTVSPTVTPAAAAAASSTATATATATPPPAPTATPAQTSAVASTTFQATPTPQAAVSPLPPKTGNAGLLGDSASGWTPAAAILALITAVVAGRLLVSRQR